MHKETERYFDYLMRRLHHNAIRDHITMVHAKNTDPNGEHHVRVETLTNEHWRKIFRDDFWGKTLPELKNIPQFPDQKEILKLAETMGFTTQSGGSTEKALLWYVHHPGTGRLAAVLLFWIV